MWEDRYCPRCIMGQKIQNIEETPRPVWPKCGKIIFYDPKLVATVVAQDDGKGFMVRGATEPYLGFWGFSVDYVHASKVVEETSGREVYEETGTIVSITGLLGLFFQQREHAV